LGALDEGVYERVPMSVVGEGTVGRRGRNSNNEFAPRLRPHVPCPHPLAPQPSIPICLPQLGELSAELEGKYRGAHADLCSIRDALQVPNIIHSTVMRAASEPRAGGGERLAEGLAGLGARWEPATVKVGEISLVHEAHPYMHLSREGAEARSYPLVPCD